LINCLATRCVIIAIGVVLAVGMLILQGGNTLANQQPTSFESEDLEEIRENVMEVRLALQKGDLIEALQHLNNVDEDLLLLETGLKPSSSASVSDNSNDSNSTSYSQIPILPGEDAGFRGNYDGGDINTNNSSMNNSNNNYNLAIPGQNNTHSNDTIFSTSKNTLNNGSSESSAGSATSDDSIRKLNVTFNSIIVNDNHDILFPAEWQIDAYVNNKRIPLSGNAELDRVERGQVINFHDKSLAIDVPNNSTLRIMTVGAELDEGAIDGKYKNNGSVMELRGVETNDGVLPDISGILDTEAPLPEYKDKAEDSIQFLTTYDRNDAIGMIAKEYDARSNFGIGDHIECSESTGEVGDIFDTVDTNCDYRLSYTIKEM
jgi:hypothetical protein